LAQRFTHRSVFFQFPAKQSIKTIKRIKVINPAATIRTFSRKINGFSCLIIFQNTFHINIESKSSRVISKDWRLFFIGFYLASCCLPLEFSDSRLFFVFQSKSVNWSWSGRKDRAKNRLCAAALGEAETVTPNAFWASFEGYIFRQEECRLN
jgi:hypothetical protein